MFNRKLEVKLVKDQKQEDVVRKEVVVNTESIKAVAKDVVKYVAIGIVSIMAAATVLDTTSQVIINNTKPEED